ncbi:anti-sigma factor family protein [Rugamonas rubra]|uniref:Transmembrane transcriptional regulator (Anti-sigma factor RsiW) n=1 Tax=Rugamonas rubra TaxID=758825 RepID=A0A1I4M815_9BURK|nr:hypothetical protein [Rugamonas rubra]SFL99384.1 hypothetical protein SAMN02982985_02308 [Rugamonas rubra]
MSFSDDTLMVYADGGLDPATRRALEQAMQHDAALARRVAHQRALRAALYAPLEGAARAAPAWPPPGRQRAGSVVQLAAVRANRAAQAGAARRARLRHWRWLDWAALGLLLALALVLGAVLGRTALAGWQPPWGAGPAGANGAMLASGDGVLTAQGLLATALDQQLGGAAPLAGDVRVGLSFVARQGGYCRSFTLGGASEDLSGLACRGGAQWRIPVLVQVPRPQPQMGAYRMAGVNLPAALLEAIDQRIDGGMLDPHAELDALRKGWQR